MKLLLLVVLLTGCMNFNFDSTEYDHLISIKETADLAKTECGTVDVKKSVGILKRQVDHQQLYAKYRQQNRAQIAHATTTVQNMVDALYKMYHSDIVPSTTYCTQKMEHISIGVDIILQEIGKL